MADYNYVFTAGRYRAKIKTTYRRDDMSMNDSIYSNAYEFTSTYQPTPTPPEPSVERKNLIYCSWGSGSVTFRATVGQQYSFRYNNVDYDDCYYPFAFWAGQNDMRVVGGDLDNYGTSYIYYNCASYAGSACTVHQLDDACPVFDSFNEDCLTWARRGYL